MEPAQPGPEPQAGLFGDACPPPAAPASKPAPKPRRKRSRGIIGWRPPKTRREIRQELAAELTARLWSLALRHAAGIHNGMVDVQDPRVWRAVARALGIRVFWIDQPGGPLGLYVPAAYDCAIAGSIAINRTLPAPQRSRVWVHELMHHLIVQHPQPILLEVSGAGYEYRGDRRQVSHYMAALGEDAIFVGIRCPRPDRRRQQSYRGATATIAKPCMSAYAGV